MSTNQECLFLEWGGRWYYILEHYNAPKNAWDWMDNATTYGPFASEELANWHLKHNHANPGGSHTVREAEITGEARRAQYARLVATATLGGSSRGNRFNY